MNTKVVPVEPLYIISADKGKLTVMSVTDALAGTRIPAAPDRNEQILAAQDRHSLPSSPSDRWKGPYVQPNTSGSIADVPKPAPSKESKLPLSAEQIESFRLHHISLACHTNYKETNLANKAKINVI